MGFNNPMPVPLKDETRKAYKIIRSFVDVNHNGLDKVIPRQVLERAHGFAIFTVAKAGFLFSARAGSGVVIARLEDGSWSPPSAIAIGGLGFGGQVGAEVTDFLVVLNSRSAVASFMSAGSITLGGNLSVAVGPMGRNAEGSGALNTKGQIASMYSYSKTKGLFGGVSVEGSVFTERQDANRIAYGGNPTAKQILTGAFSPPDWAYVLIDELDRATGLPGGHRWVKDEPEDEGAMGWSTPTGTGKSSTGYAFGEGVGAGGTSSKNRKRSSSLFSIGGGNKAAEAATTGAVFNASRPPAAGNQLSYSAAPESPRRGSQVDTPPTPDQRAAPSRPWEQRRASSYLPFSNSLSNISFKSSSAAERKAGPSSETYNADYQPKVVARARAGSNPQRPYAEGPTPSPFADFGPPLRTPITPVDSPTRSPALNSDSEWGARSGRMSANGTGNGYHSLSNHGSRASSLSSRAPGSLSTNGRTQTNSSSSSGDEPDLLGSWDANDRGLTPTFARLTMRTNSNGSLSSGLKARRSSTLPFEDIDEEGSRARLRETTSSFANKDWVGGNTGNGRRAFSTYGAPEGWPGTGTAVREREDNPFQEHEYDRSRPFDDYTVPARKSSRGGAPLTTSSSLSLSNIDPMRRASLNGSVNGHSDQGPEAYARAVALFDFTPGEVGDLGLKKGQIVYVTDKADAAAAWWRGQLKGSNSQGIFPANYVEVLDIPRRLRGGITKTQLRTRLLTGLEFD